MIDKKVTKPDRGDVFGTLWATKNIDLSSKKGSIRLSVPFDETFNSADDDSDLKTPVAFVRTNADGTDRWWTMGVTSLINRYTGLLFKSTDTDPSSVWAQDATASTPADVNDQMCLFGKVTTDRLIVARPQNLAMLENGTWTTQWWSVTLGQSVLNEANPHYPYPFLNLLLVPDGNVVHTIDDSLVVTLNRLVFPKEYKVLWVHKDNNTSYFGTQNIRGGEGLIFAWNGTDEKYSYAYPIGADRSYAGQTDEEGILHIMTGDGVLKSFNGAGFGEAARLPFEFTSTKWSKEVTAGTIGTLETVMHPNGMTMEDGRLNMLLNIGFQGYSGTPINFGAGIWEYDPDVGLYCKSSLPASILVAGATRLAHVGALQATNSKTYPMLAGASHYTDSGSSQRHAVFIKFGQAQGNGNRGYFITSRIESGTSFRSFWKRLQMHVEKMQSTTGDIVIRYRTDRSAAFPDWDLSAPFFTGTMASSTTFTINDADGASIEEGDVVEIINGVNEGRLRNVASIVNTSANNYTITIESSLSVTSGTMTVRVMKFKQLGTFESITTEKKLLNIVKRSKWIQLFIEMGGTQNYPAIEEFFIEFEPSER